MSPERRLAAAKRGAERQQELGKKHKWTSETGQAAGRKGGLRAQALRRERDQTKETP